MRYPAPLTALIRELGRLPGIGPKSAQRLAFHLFNRPEEDVRALADALVGAKTGLALCPRCFNVMGVEEEACGVCLDPTRDQTLMCVVEQPADLLAIERSGEYRGVYHVLHGALSPMNGVGPDQLTIEALLGRLTDVEVASPRLAEHIANRPRVHVPEQFSTARVHGSRTCASRNPGMGATSV